MVSTIRRRACIGLALVALVAVLGLLAPSASAIPSTAPTPPGKPVVVKLNGDGAGMSAGLPDETDGKICPVIVSVEPGGTVRNPVYYLYLDVSVWDPTLWPCDEKECPPPPPDQTPPGGCRWIGGVYYDPIPSGDFTIASPQTYVLHTTASITPYTCDENGCTEGDPISVPISLTWERSGSWTYKFTGTQAFRSLGSTVHQSGNGTYYSAEVTGTVFGREIMPSAEYSSAYMNSYKQTVTCRAPAGDPSCDYMGGPVG